MSTGSIRWPCLFLAIAGRDFDVGGVFVGAGVDERDLSLPTLAMYGAAVMAAHVRIGVLPVDVFAVVFMVLELEFDSMRARIGIAILAGAGRMLVSVGAFTSRESSFMLDISWLNFSGGLKFCASRRVTRSCTGTSGNSSRRAFNSSFGKAASRI